MTVLPAASLAPRVALFLGSVAGVVPPADRAAAGLAARRLGGRFQAWCLRDDEAARRYALGAGATAAAMVEDLDRVEFDVALVGPAGAGPWGDLLPAWLAAHRGAALALEVLDVVPGSDGLLVLRDLGRGAREELTLDGPAVLAVSAAAPLRLYVSRRRQRAALPGPTPPGPAGLADPLAAASGPWEPWRPRVRAGRPAEVGSPTERLNALLGAEARREAPASQVIVADPRTCAQTLVRFLVQHGVVTRSGRPGSEAAAAEETGQPAAAPGRSGDAAAGPATSRAPAPGAAADPGRLARGPRPLGRDRAGRVAGPVPVAPAPSRGVRDPASGEPARDRAVLSRLARGPRPPGQPGPSRLKGPFPVS